MWWCSQMSTYAAHDQTTTRTSTHEYIIPRCGPASRLMQRYLLMLASPPLLQPRRARRGQCAPLCTQHVRHPDALADHCNDAYSRDRYPPVP